MSGNVQMDNFVLFQYTMIIVLFLYIWWDENKDYKLSCDCHAIFRDKLDTPFAYSQVLALIQPFIPVSLPKLL